MYLYECHFLDHTAIAILVVRNAQRDLMDGTWYLEALNDEGTNKYDFSFAPYARPEPLDVKPGTDDGDNSSMSGGTIAGNSQ